MYKVRGSLMKHKGIESLTREQQDEICAIIGDWYLQWKHGLINWDERTHRLGYAKEKLKEMICGSPNEIEEDFR